MAYDVTFSDRGNFYHLKWLERRIYHQVLVAEDLVKFIGTGTDNVASLLNGTKSSASGIASPPGGGPGGPGGGDAPPAAQMRSAGGSKPLPPPSRGQKLSDLVAQQEVRCLVEVHLLIHLLVLKVQIQVLLIHQTLMIFLQLMLMQ